MATHHIALIPGDGIGTEVVNEGVRVLRALEKKERGLRFSFTKFPWGSDFYHQSGRMCPENYLSKIEKFDAILLGAVGRPDIPDHITLHQLLLPIRRGFDLYANIRPIVLYKGLESPLRGYAPGDIDMLFFRENVEGEYSPVGGRHYEGFPEEIAIQNAIFTRRGCDRIITIAFEHALKRRKHVTNVTKSNAQGYTLVLWDEVFKEVAARPRYKKVKTAKYLVDAAALEFVRRPAQFDVVVSTNLFADILTDLGAGIVGGLGVAASANLNPARKFPGLFEPVHGSAPDIMGKGIANPAATLFSCAMMLDYLGEAKAAKRLEAAVRAHLAGDVKTRDLGGTATTKQAGSDVIGRL